MRLENPLILRDVEVTTLSVNPNEEEEPRPTLVVQCPFNAALASELGIHDLVYLPNDVARSGFAKIDLDAELTDVLVATASGLDRDALTMTPTKVDGFSIKVGKSGGLRLSLKVKAEGFVVPLSEFFAAVNGKQFTLRIEPLQQKLPLDVPAEAKPEAEPEPVAAAAPADDAPWV